MAGPEGSAAKSGHRDERDLQTAGGGAMRWIRLHGFSLASLGLSAANIYVCFVVMSESFWGAPFNYRAGPEGYIAWSPIVLGFGSIMLASVGVGKEHGKTCAVVAVCVSAAGFFLCLARHAV